MKIRNKKEYIYAVAVRRNLKKDIKECKKKFEPRNYPSQYHIALTLVDIFDLMIICYENGATTELTLEVITEIT